MSKAKEGLQSHEASGRRPLRWLPGVIIVALQWLIRFIFPVLMPDAAGYAAFAGPLGWLAVVLWWVFFSRAPRLERWGGFLLMVATLALTRFFLHESIAKASFGVLFFVFATPFTSLAFVAWAVLTRHLSDRPRRAMMVFAVLLSGAVWTLFKIGGVDAVFHADLSWRWTLSPEQRLLAGSGDEPFEAPSGLTVSDTEAEWPGFRGPQRDGIVHGVKILTDWSQAPPVEVWRKPVGPGWSSFSVQGDHFYTQEQRGEEEVVSCYSLSTGDAVWQHRDTARFWEAVGGAGPRGTPTLHRGRVYTLGATGIMNVLQASDGRVLWSRNAAEDTQTKIPTWAFSSSPLVVEDKVVVAVAGALVAYALDTGAVHWLHPAEGGACYSSPHLVELDGVTQILLQNAAGIFGVSPGDGKKLWEHAWPGGPIVQPALTGDGDLLVSVDERTGIRRLSVRQQAGEWTVQTRWTSARLKPYFNDSVIHKGHVYGFDGPKLACIDIEDGARQWKGGRYGRGQLILLADQDLLLVLSEKGELALVEAVPGQFTELARHAAVKGKSWSHPVVVGEMLLVRNAQEMAAFRLARADR